MKCGDFNMTVEDAPEEFSNLRRDRWSDAALFGIHGFDNSPTSLQGKGARIDLAFLNETAASLIDSYKLRDGVLGARHMVIDLSFRVMLASQVTYMQKSIPCRGMFQKPPPNYVPSVIPTDLDLRACLARGEMELPGRTAFETYSF